MAGYETRKRDFSRDYRYATRNNGVTHPYGALGILSRTVSNQETTSYRTHGREDIQNSQILDTRVSYNPFVESNPTLKDSDGKLWDNGHEFFTRKSTESYSHDNVFVKSANGNSWFRGPLVLGNNGQQIVASTVSKMSNNDIKYYGAKAIKMTTPTQPLANTAQMIGELISDGLPITGAALRHFADRFDEARLILNTAKSPYKGLNWREYISSVGDATLIAKFGVEPLVSDILDIMSAVSNAARRIEQWQRDSGKQIRRSITVSEESSVTTSQLSGGGFLGGLTFGWPTDPPLKTGPKAVIRSTSVKTKIKFSGAHMYYATVGETLLDRIVDYGRKADLILGMKPNFETLWELTPWSWLVDWKANVGDAISNATRFSADKLVLRYGYLQRSIIIFDTYSGGPVSFYDGQTATPLRRFSVVQKERYRATPYGFGLDPNGFTASQWAILAALGMSKGGRKLP